MTRPVVMLGPRPTAPAMGWTFLSARATGAHHSAAGSSCEDAVATLVDGEVTVLAVSDGHGHHRHFRSGRGSQFAVEVATEVSAQWWRSRDISPPPTEAEVRSHLLPAVWHRWVERVGDDVAADSFTAAERSVLQRGDDPMVAYGATLLFALLTPAWMIVAQVGDGDAVVVGDGESGTPLPEDPYLDGIRTTSLCQPQALRSFRVAVRDLAAAPVRAVLLATDGYGNAQTDPGWKASAGPQLLEMVTDKGLDWVASRLGSWVERCASADGSGDDTTVVIGFSAVPLPPPIPRRRGVRRPYRAMALAGVVAALTGTGLGLAITSGGSGHRAPAPDPLACCSSPMSDQGTEGSSPTLPIEAGEVTATVPGTGTRIGVPLPPAVAASGALSAIEQGFAVYVLAGDGRVWRLPLPATRPAVSVAASAPLERPMPPLGYISGAVTVSGDSGRVTYHIDTARMTVSCWDSGLGLPARTQCPAGQGGHP